MGYRSQVAGCFSVDRELRVDEQGRQYSYYDKDKFKALVGFIKLSTFWERWNTKADQDVFGWKDGYFILFGDDWKWYYDYSDVKAWDQLWESMQQVGGVSGYFCRVGEDPKDIEEDSFGDDPCFEFFHAFSALQFDGDDFLGERVTDAKEEQAEQAPANP